jgi:hypothetical protein
MDAGMAIPLISEGMGALVKSFVTVISDIEQDIVLMKMDIKNIV